MLHNNIIHQHVHITHDTQTCHDGLTVHTNFYTHLNGCLCMREADYCSLASGGLLLLLLLLRTATRVRVKSLSGAWSFGVQAGRVFPVILVV